MIILTLFLYMYTNLYIQDVVTCMYVHCNNYCTTESHKLAKAEHIVTILSMVAYSPSDLCLISESGSGPSRILYFC